MRNTILFDLDGTLLPMDFQVFMKLYFENMEKYFYSYDKPKSMFEMVMASTEQMIKTNDGRTNEDIFMTYFGTYVGDRLPQFIDRFNSFYEELFENVKASTYQSPIITKCIKLLKDKGYTLVIATNPLFPFKANLHRIRWAGLNKNDFSYITSFEENKHCKPYPQFYQEVLSKIDKNPEECIMVGNDVEEDLVSGKLGLETYLITDCIINAKNLENTANHTGNYNDFLDFCNKLPNINLNK